MNSNVMNNSVMNNRATNTATAPLTATQRVWVTVFATAVTLLLVILLGLAG